MDGLEFDGVCMPLRLTADHIAHRIGALNGRGSRYVNACHLAVLRLSPAWTGIR